MKTKMPDRTIKDKTMTGMEDNLAENCSNFNCVWSNSNMEISCRFPLNSFPVNPGFEISVVNIKPQKNLYARQEIKPSAIEVCFCLGGGMSVMLSSVKEKIALKQGQVPLLLRGDNYPDTGGLCLKNPIK